MTSGSVKINDINRMPNFVETFSLAPQQNGYFVLNDIFHFTDDGKFHTPPPSAILDAACSSLSKFAITSIQMNRDCVVLSSSTHRSAPGFVLMEVPIPPKPHLTSRFFIASSAV
ncbi:Nuclear transport factor 2 [Sesbania bispinosa]|nr:Nuclear transport factor 2 [Sesbania bispinosa]